MGKNSTYYPFNIIYQDQAFIPGKAGEYPEELETYRTTESGLEILLRPVKISDEPLLKKFFYDLSDESIHWRFSSMRPDMPHKRLQEFAIIDFTKEMVILAERSHQQKPEIIGIGQYAIDAETHAAEVAFVVRDDDQNHPLFEGETNNLLYLVKKLTIRN